jgi:hypothetical protein
MPLYVGVIVFLSCLILAALVSFLNPPLVFG